MPRDDSSPESRSSRKRSAQKSAQPVSGPGRDAFRRKNARANYVVGPNGDIITLADLPSARSTRWVLRRKAEIVLAVRGGLLSLDDACKRYELSVQEFYAWQSAVARRGLLDGRAQKAVKLPDRFR